MDFRTSERMMLSFCLVGIILVALGNRMQSFTMSAVGAALMVLGLVVWGSLRLSAPPSAMTENIRLRLVQPNIAQNLKWDPQARAANFERTLSLSSLPTPIAPTCSSSPTTRPSGARSRSWGRRASTPSRSRWTLTA